MKKILASLLILFALFVHSAQAEFTVNDMAGFNVGGEPPTPTYEYCGHTIITSNTTSYSFATHSICTAAADRVVLVAVKRFRVSGTVNINAPTIGGNAMTLVSGSSTGCGTATTCVEWYQRAESSGTTATIAFTTSASANNGSIAVYAIYGYSSSTVESAVTDIATAYSLPLSNSSGAAIFAACFSNSVTTATWTGATEDYDAQSEAAMTYSGASASNAAASTTITPTYGSETGLSCSAVAYR